MNLVLNASNFVLLWIQSRASPINHTIISSASPEYGYPSMHVKGGQWWKGVHANELKNASQNATTMFVPKRGEIRSATARDQEIRRSQRRCSYKGKEAKSAGRTKQGPRICDGLGCLYVPHASSDVIDDGWTHCHMVTEAQKGLNWWFVSIASWVRIATRASSSSTSHGRILLSLLELFDFRFQLLVVVGE